jgi:hypothetical protein
VEQDLFEVDHCQAGVWLIENLGFPQELHSVVAHHHHAPTGNAFRMVHLIRIADLMTDALGYTVWGPIDRQGFEEVVEQMPEPARSRFHADPERLTAEIDSRIQSWQ